MASPGWTARAEGACLLDQLDSNNYVSISSDPSAGRKLVSKARIPKGQPLLTVPLGTTFCVARGENRRLPHKLAKMVQQEWVLPKLPWQLSRLLQTAPPADVRLAYWLSWARCSNANASPGSDILDSYLSLLPLEHELGGLLLASSNELQLLDSSERQEAEEMQSRALKAHEWYARDLPAGMAPASQKDFFWALANVLSRGFCPKHHLFGPGEDITLLVPGCDLANHSFYPNSDMRIFFPIPGDGDDSAFAIVALQDIEQGEEITLCYGDFSNWKLLKLYGFCVPCNPHDRLDFSANLLLPERYKTKAKRIADRVFGSSTVEPLCGNMDHVARCEAIIASIFQHPKRNNRELMHQTVDVETKLRGLLEEANIMVSRIPPSPKTHDQTNNTKIDCSKPGACQMAIVSYQEEKRDLAYAACTLLEAMLCESLLPEI